MRLIEYNFRQTASVEPCSKNNEDSCALEAYVALLLVRPHDGESGVACLS